MGGAVRVVVVVEVGAGTVVLVGAGTVLVAPGTVVGIEVAAAAAGPTCAPARTRPANAATAARTQGLGEAGINGKTEWPCMGNRPPRGESGAEIVRRPETVRSAA